MVLPGVHGSVKSMGGEGGFAMLFVVCKVWVSGVRLSENVVA